VGSGVTPQGQINYTKDIYLAKSDGSAPRRLTTFDPTNYAPGATGVAISPDGTRGGYLAILNSGGMRTEEVHTLDIATGTDRRIAVNTTGCIHPTDICPDCFTPCLQSLSFSQDGTKLIWSATAPANGNQIFVINYDGSGLQQIATGFLSDTMNVTTSDGRLIFTNATEVQTVRLDGSELTTIYSSSGGELYPEANISADGTTLSEVFCNQGFGGPNGCSLGTTRTILDVSPTPSFSGVALSGDGSVAAWIHYGAAGRNSAGSLNAVGVAAQVGPFLDPSFDTAFDVGLSSDGASLLYSTGLGSVRGAVWICDRNGQNARRVFAPRSISNNGITGLSGGAALQLLSPGSYFTIYGTNFEPGSAIIVAAALPLPATIAGITVMVNGAPVPIQAVTPWQINALLPQDARTGLAVLRVRFEDGFTLSATPTVAPTAPALITYVFAGTTYAAVFHGGSATPADPRNPAHAGEVMASYGFGLGATDPSVNGGDAAPASPLARTVAMPQVLVDGKPTTVLYTGLVPGLAGLYQINFVVPEGLTSGPHSVAWKTPDVTQSPAGIMFLQ
jgi:uncharacterized protein (TIGR03437 family)